MPLHDKPVSNYPHKTATPKSVTAWLKACAYEGIGNHEEAEIEREKCSIYIELYEARLKHQLEERNKERQR